VAANVLPSAGMLHAGEGPSNGCLMLMTSWLLFRVSFKDDDRDFDG